MPRSEGQLIERFGDRRAPGRLRTRVLDGMTVVGFDAGLPLIRAVA